MAADNEEAEVTTSAPPPPLVLDGTAKLQLAVLLGTNFLIQMGVGMIITVLPLFAQSIGFGAAGIGLIIALPQLTKLALNLPIGHLVDVYGRKPCLVWGSLIDAAGQLATGLSTALAPLVPARLLVGVGSATGGVTGPATTAYTMDVVGNFPDHSGTLLGLIQAVGFLAFAVGPTIGGWLAERTTPAMPFLVLGLMQLVCVPLKLLLPETLTAERRAIIEAENAPNSNANAEGGGGDGMASTDGAGGLAGLRTSMGGMFASYRQLLADPRQIALLAMKCGFLCGLSLILTVVPLHATSVIGASAVELGRLYSFVTLLALPLSVLAGVMADRIGRKPLAIAGALTTALSIASVPFTSGKLGYSVVRALWSSGEALLITAYSALSLDVTPKERRGARNSLDNQVSDVALLFLPLIIGAVGQLVSVNAAFWLASVLMVGSVGVVAKLL